MTRRLLLTILLLGAVVVPGLVGVSAGIRSVGLRLVLPFAAMPPLLGLELVADAPFGAISASLFLSSAGGTLLLGSADIALTEAPSRASAFLRLTSGLSHADRSRLLPSLLIGAGLSFRLSILEPFALGFAGELVYPIAFPLPMLTLSGAWSLP
jgi:hypothetical protein